MLYVMYIYIYIYIYSLCGDLTIISPTMLSTNIESQNVYNMLYNSYSII